MHATIRSAAPALFLSFAVAGCSAATSGPAARPAAPRQVITAAGGAAPRAPYSPAIRVGDLIFFSGQIGGRPGGGMAEDLQGQVRQALENLRALMTAANIGPQDLVKCSVFLADIADYGAMNEVYGQFFQGNPPPARTALSVAGLPAGARVEIECIGAVPH
jgi:reactive intermediate/imine deaminase